MSEQSDQDEVILFTRPQRASTVLLGRLPRTIAAHNIKTLMCEFGLVHSVTMGDEAPGADSPPPVSHVPELQFVWRTNKRKVAMHDDDLESDSRTWALVSFYSIWQAGHAVTVTKKRLCLACCSSSSRVYYLTAKMARERHEATLTPLYLNRCIELASHFIGFDALSIEIVDINRQVLRAGERAADGSVVLSDTCLCRVAVRGTLPDGRSAIGIGRSLREEATLATALRRAQRIAADKAIEDFYHSLALVRLADGRVIVHIIDQGLSMWCDD
jgi:hypothetical protein